jgi:3-methyladenine DNA glycosylase AlkD
MGAVRKAIETRLKDLGDPEHAGILQRFFKTGRGEYGEGDVFLGLKVPEVRRLARGYRDLALDGIFDLLKSRYHEARLLALVLLVGRYPQCDLTGQQEIYERYLQNTRHINNWDLVDASAPHIVGAWLMDRDRSPLNQLAKSENLWERRIAIIATHAFIRTNDFADTLSLAEVLCDDPHDLIHKAVGWMLREIGKRDLAAEEAFLNKHCRHMPRTMLRYAIERFPRDLRKQYLDGAVRS